MFHYFKRHNKQGLEVPDPTPHEITLKSDFKRPLTIQEQIQRFTQAADFQRAVAAKGLDTLEEANDLDVPYDPIIETAFGRTPYEAREDVLDGVQTHLDEVNAKIAQEPSEERLERARERIKASRKQTDKPAQAGASGAAGISA